MNSKMTAIVLAAILGLSVVAAAINTAYAPNGRRGVMMATVGNTMFMIWENTEDGLIKTAYGSEPNTDMVFAVTELGKQPTKYINLLEDPTRIATDGQISANKDMISVTWWETNPALLPTNPDYTIPFRSISTDGGITWSEPQNIADLPDTPAKIIPVGSK